MSNFIFVSDLYLCIFSLVCVTYNCTVHGADLTYIPLLIIFCIIVYVHFNSIQDYLYSAFYDTIVVKQLHRKFSF